MYRYIFVSALYRLSCGALIIAVNWLMASSSSSLSWLAVTVALTFVPAMIVPLIWRNKSQNLSGKTLTQYSLLAAAILALTMTFTANHLALLAMNTLIWFFFFVMESSWESWFASECQGLTDRAIERFSSITMTANQAALMIGPLAAAYIFGNEPEKVIFLCMSLYIICFAASLFSKSVKTEIAEQKISEVSNNKLDKIKLSGTELSLLLIWPALAMFNFMLPAQVVSLGGDMMEVGLLDALMGVGMIVSGFLVANILLQNIILKYKLTLLLLLLAMIAWSLGDSLFYRLIAVFLLGLCFNIQRIVIRARLAKKYEPSQVGQLVSRANSFSFVIIAISLFFFRDQLSLNWSIPFIFSMLMGALIPMTEKSMTEKETMPEKLMN